MVHLASTRISYIGHKSRRTPRHSLAAVENRLQRFREAPISARVVHYNSPHTIPFVDALLRCPHRLSQLGLVEPAQDVLAKFLHAIHDSSGCTAFLALVFHGMPEHRVFACLSFLTNLHLASIYRTVETRNYIPWAQLSKYCEVSCEWHNEGDRWTSYRQLFSAIELCVAITGIFKEPWDPVVFPALLHARSSCWGEPDFLQNFDTLVLESLSYDFDFGRDFRPTVQLSRSLYHLKILRVRVNAPASLDFRGMLEGSLELTEIFIEIRAIPISDLVSNLIPAEGQPPLGPKLEKIRFGWDAYEVRGDCRTYGACGQIVEMMRLRSHAETVSWMCEFVLYDAYAEYHSCGDADATAHEGPQGVTDEEGFKVSVRSKEQGFFKFLKGHWCSGDHLQCL